MRFRPILLAAAAVAAAITAPAAQADKVVGAKASGKTVRVTKGERLTIRLTECGPCGYRWYFALKPAGAVLRKLSDRYTQPPGDAIGGPGKRIIAYRARAVGITRLRLVYRGPDGSIAESYRLRIRVV